MFGHLWAYLARCEYREGGAARRKVGIGHRKEAQVSRRRWSMTTEDVSKTQKTGARRWSLKNGKTLKPILKQQNTQKDKNLQSVNFRQKGNSLYTILESAIKYILAKVKTFREANSSVYEPVDVVDYVMVKGKIQCQSYMIKSYFHRIRSEWLWHSNKYHPLPHTIRESIQLARRKLQCFNTDRKVWESWELFNNVDMLCYD